MAEEVELVGKVLGVVGDGAEVGIRVLDVDVAAGEGEQGPEIEVHGAVGVEEELRVRDVVVGDLVDGVVVLHHQGINVVEAAAGDHVLGPLAEQGLVAQHGVCGWSEVSECFVECREVCGLALTIASGGGAVADSGGGLVLLVDADGQIDDLGYASVLEDFC